MKKIKILYTIPNFDTAGSGKVLYDLAQHLDKDKFEIVIACNHNGGIFFKEVEALGHQIYFIETTTKLKPYLTIFYRVQDFKNFLINNNIDIVHSWNWSSDWTEGLATRLAGAKYIYTKKAMSWGNVHWKIKSYLSNFIITINDEMINFFPHKKNQKLIPIGLDTDYYQPKLFAEKPESNSFKIITVANLVAVKAIERIIYAIHQLNNPNIVLEIVGNYQTNYGTEMMQLVSSLKLEKQIVFLGKHIDVRPFLSQADLYIICSKKEGMPMALVEAMTMGVPVLGANIPGINYVLKSFPNLLFDAADHEDLAKNIQSIMKKSVSEREHLGKELRDFSIQNFSMQTFISQHQELYRNLYLKKNYF